MRRPSNLLSQVVEIILKYISLNKFVVSFQLHTTVHEKTPNLMTGISHYQFKLREVVHLVIPFFKQKT
jgi:hypothetical protein